MLSNRANATKNPDFITKHRQNFCGLKGLMGLRYFPIMPETHYESVFFSGRVQGVGFRYLVMQVAREFEVAGNVRNLSDGRVQIEAEGATGEVEAFIAAVGERMHGYIRKTERTARQREAQFHGFQIK